MNLYVEVFSHMFTCLKRGRDNHGNLSLAKPIFVLSLLEYVPFMKNNVIEFRDGMLFDFYESNMKFWEIEYKSPILNPFYHLGSEPFFELVWKDDSIMPIKRRTPSAKFLRENLEYAKLDDDLWELLQDSTNREYLKQAVIAKYLQK